MATSSGEDVPRNVEFLFSRNRFRGESGKGMGSRPALLSKPCLVVKAS